MKKGLAAVGTVLALTFVPMYQARAWTCCDPWGWVGQAAFIQAGAAVVTAITAAAGAVVAASQLVYLSFDNGFAKLNAELAKQTAMRRTFRQGTVGVDSQLYMQERSGEAAERAVVPAQQSVTITNAALLSEQSGIVRQKIAKMDGDFSKSFYALKPVDQSVVIERHRPYCSGADLDLGRCDTPASPTMQNADLSVTTFLNPGDGQYETLSDEERDAAIAFVANAVNPIPATRLSELQGKSEQAKAVEAAMLADQAALAVAAHSFNAAIAHRTRRHQQ